MSGTRVSDLEPLRGLAKLAVLGLSDTPISDLSPVAALPAIRDAEQLDLSGTQLSSLIDLGRAPRLRELRAIGTPIEALPRLPALEVLRIDDTRVHDLSSLAAAAGLAAAVGGRDAGLRASVSLPALRELDVARTQISDLGPLRDMTALEELMLAETPVADVEPLAGLTGLLELQLQGTHVVDVAPLAGLTQLQGLNLARTPVHDVTPLAALGNLQWVRLSGRRGRPRHRDLAATPAAEPARPLDDEGDRPPEAAGRALELVREEDEVRAARGELAEVR